MYLLQTETLEDLRDWIACLNWTRRFDGDISSNKDQEENSSIVDSFQQSSSVSSNDSSSLSRSTSSLTARPSSTSTATATATARINRRSYKAKSTTTITTPKDIPVTLSTSKTPVYNNLPNNTKLHSISGLVFSSSRSSFSTTHQQQEEQGSPSSAVTYVSNTLSKHGTSLMACLSLSPVLVWEAARSKSIQSTQVPDSLWGVPWPILGTMLIADKRSVVGQQGAVTSTEKSGVLWPLACNSSSSLNVDISNYELQEDNNMLRKMFGGVKPDEVVLDGKSKPYLFLFSVQEILF